MIETAHISKFNTFGGELIYDEFKIYLPISFKGRW